MVAQQMQHVRRILVPLAGRAFILRGTRPRRGESDRGEGIALAGSPGLRVREDLPGGPVGDADAIGTIHLTAKLHQGKPRHRPRAGEGSVDGTIRHGTRVVRPVVVGRGLIPKQIVNPLDVALEHARAVALHIPDPPAGDVDEGDVGEVPLRVVEASEVGAVVGEVGRL